MELVAESEGSGRGRSIVVCFASGSTWLRSSRVIPFSPGSDWRAGGPRIDSYIHTPGPVKGWYHRTFHTPPLLNASFIVQFDKQQAHAQRERFISIYNAGQGSYGLRRTAWSVEGTPIVECLVVDNGLLTIVMDYTRDSYGNREFSVQHPTSVKLDTLGHGEVWGFAPTNDSMYLKSYADSKLIHCF